VKSKREIEERIRFLMEASDDRSAIIQLKWVLEDADCPMCAHDSCSVFETEIHNGTITPAFLEQKMGWPTGTVDRHMKEHTNYNTKKADEMEMMRSESINTLSTAEDLMQRMVGWLDELEERRQIEGVTSEWIADATKLTAQCHTGLKLIGQLKKEIGVDSQLLLADRKYSLIRYATNPNCSMQSDSDWRLSSPLPP
jgi:hypothetical protein